MSDSIRNLQTSCVIAGGGPAGMMAGFLLARAGVDVIVCEKHRDFLRDFRGDTIHPSTLQLMWELGLLEKFLARPHQEVRELTAEFGNRKFKAGDFTHLPVHTKFLALMPQWDFLDFIAGEAKRYPGFRLLMQTEAAEPLRDRNRICGLGCSTPEGRLNIQAGLVIAADGRHSHIRQAAGLKVQQMGSAIDVLWLKMPFEAGDPTEPVARFGAGQVLVMIYRTDYWQCALVIPKNGFDELKRSGIAALRARLKEIAGFAANRVDTIETFDDVSLLTVTIDRLERWSTHGLVAIGDAAHAMSPVGGVGINLAIQDAVATANILSPILQRNRTPSRRDLDRIQRRRQWPMQVIQGFQLLVQNRILSPGLRRGTQPSPPLFLRLLDRIAWLRQFPARFIGLGPRPEHIHTKDILAR